MNYNEPLKNAVIYLKGSNQIKNQDEVRQRLQITKGNLSNYINGRVKAPQKVITAFEKEFKLKLSEFKQAKEPPKLKAVSAIDFQSFVITKITTIESMIYAIAQTIAANKSGIRNFDKLVKKIEKEIQGL